MRSHGAVQLARVIIFSTDPLLDCQSGVFFFVRATTLERIERSEQTCSLDRPSLGLAGMTYTDVLFLERRRKLELVHQEDGH